jgi:hypothetical protein
VTLCASVIARWIGLVAFDLMKHEDGGNRERRGQEREHDVRKAGEPCGDARGEAARQEKRADQNASSSTTNPGAVDFHGGSAAAHKGRQHPGLGVGDGVAVRGSAAWVIGPEWDVQAASG